jgi:hypothetical protein
MFSPKVLLYSPNAYTLDFFDSYHKIFEKCMDGSCITNIFV